MSRRRQADSGPTRQQKGAKIQGGKVFRGDELEKKRKRKDAWRDGSTPRKPRPPGIMDHNAKGREGPEGWWRWRTSPSPLNEAEPPA